MSLRAFRLPVTILSGLALAASLSLGGSSQANTATANLEVSATITNNCTISTSALAFGSYDPIVAHKSADLDGEGGVTVTCTNGAAVTITLDEGVSPHGDSTAEAPLRRMASGGNFLAYQLFSNAGRTTIWGATAAVDVEDTGTGLVSNHTVYGRIAQDQNVPAGAYTDTVVATVTF